MTYSRSDNDEVGATFRIEGREVTLCRKCYSLPPFRGLDGFICRRKEAREEKITCDQCGERLSY